MHLHSTRYTLSPGLGLGLGLPRTVTARTRVFLASKVRGPSPSGKRGTLPPEGDPEIPKMRSRAHPHCCLSPQNAPGRWSSHAVIWAVFGRSLRLISEAGGLASGSEPASGVMYVEAEPYLGHPSRSRYVVGPPARRKSRSEKVSESDFGSRRGPPPADTATTTYPSSREGPIPCE